MLQCKIGTTYINRHGSAIVHVTHINCHGNANIRPLERNGHASAIRARKLQSSLPTHNLHLLPLLLFIYDIIV